MKLKQVNELLKTHLVECFNQPASGNTIRQFSELKEGINQDNAKKIVLEVKKLNLKFKLKFKEMN